MQPAKGTSVLMELGKMCLLSDGTLQESCYYSFDFVLDRVSHSFMISIAKTVSVIGSYPDDDGH